jgi:hypothetical protein
MNSTIYIAASVILILVLLGIIISRYNRYKKKQEKNRLMREFDEFTIKHNLAIDKKQTLNKNMIGIDRMNFKLVFLDKSSDAPMFHLIDLTDISECRLVKQKNDSTGYISSIFLRCTFNKKGIEPVILPFYNEMKDDLFKMLRLSRKASYWEKSINLFRESALLLQNA